MKLFNDVQLFQINIKSTQYRKKKKNFIDQPHKLSYNNFNLKDN